MQATVASEDLELCQKDLKTAFLNGDLSENINAEQLDGFDQVENLAYIRSFHKALYGLKQAPRKKCS